MVLEFIFFSFFPRCIRESFLVVTGLKPFLLTRFSGDNGLRLGIATFAAGLLPYSIELYFFTLLSLFKEAAAAYRQAMP